MTTRSDGFSLLEFMLAVALLLLLFAGLAPTLIQSAQMNRSQQLAAEAQGNARACVTLITERLRSNGWDPRQLGVPPLTLGPISGGGTDSIAVFGDLDENGTLNNAAGSNEAVLIRHQGDRIEWRRGAAGTFETLAENITDDADGDGTAEPLFVPSPLANPRVIIVRVTARSPTPDPRTGDFARFTVISEVVLRNNL